MKTLALIRHAKSSWNDPSLSDFERPLNTRGKRDAPAMAQVLSHHGLEQGKWISSPATRALNTAHLMAMALRMSTTQVYTDQRLYLAWTETLLEIIHEQDSAVKNLVIFAHNPGLTEMINRIAPVRLDNLPTCGIFVTRFATEEWSTIQYGSGEFVALDIPKNYH